MGNSAQTLNPNQKQQQGQKDQYSSQNTSSQNASGSKNEGNSPKVGTNIEKDEPMAQNRMKNEGDNCTNANTKTNA